MQKELEPIKVHKHRADIDGLRAVAILPVLIFHAFPRALRGGFAGVDVFFVISGFLITAIILKDLEESKFSFANFYARRVRRIFPALVPLLIGVWVMGWFLLMTDEFAMLAKHMFSSTLFMTNFTLWREAGYFDHSADGKPLLNLWSLAVEEQYYIIWPLALWLAWRAGRRYGSIIYLLFTSSFALNLFWVGYDRSGDFFLPQTRFWELLIGSALAFWTSETGSQHGVLFAFRKIPEKSIARYLTVESFIGLVCLLLSFIFLREDLAYPGYRALLPTLGTALLLDAGPQSWPNRKILSLKGLRLIGLISYALYLWHWPLLSFARLSEGGTIWIWAAILGAFVLAILSFIFIESPLRYRVTIFGRRTVTVLLAAMAAVSCLSLYSIRRQGFAERFPEVVRYLADYTNNFQYDFAYEGGAAFRYKVCFLTNAPEKIKNPNLAFASECTDQNFGDNPNSILIWGDSHAAQYYAGLRQQTKIKDVRLAQYTTGGCPPYINVGAEDKAREITLCQRDNALIVKRIQALKPPVVLLAARWSDYPLDKLPSTLASLRKMGVGRILLFGPVPEWQGSLPKNILLEIGVDPLHRFPERIKRGLEPAIASTDQKIQEIAAASGAQFVSPYRLLCNKDGCLTRNGTKPNNLIAFDYAHLTPTGSTYVIEHELDKVFE